MLDIAAKDIPSLLIAVLVRIVGREFLAHTDAPYSNILQMLILK